MNKHNNGTFVRPTSLGAALFEAANKPGANHPVGFVVKRMVAPLDDRGAIRSGFSVLEKSHSPKKPEKLTVIDGKMEVRHGHA